MTAKVTLTASTEHSVDLVLTGPERAVEELVRSLRSMGGPVSVAGGRCCWTLTRDGTTVHLVVDAEQAA